MRIIFKGGLDFLGKIWKNTPNKGQKGLPYWEVPGLNNILGQYLGRFGKLANGGKFLGNFGNKKWP